MVEIHALDRERHQLDRAVFGGQPFDDGGDQRRIVAAVQAVAVGQHQDADAFADAEFPRAALGFHLFGDAPDALDRPGPMRAFAAQDARHGRRADLRPVRQLFDCIVGKNHPESPPSSVSYACKL